jgi:hypothetical protein
MDELRAQLERVIDLLHKTSPAESTQKGGEKHGHPDGP